MGACGAIASAGPLQVATFECDVTPPMGHRLTVEPLKTVEHPLAAKGIVLDDGTTRYVLCAIDWCILSNNSHLKIREAIAKAAGTDVKNVCVQTVHQHTAPIMDADAAVLALKTKKPPKMVSTTHEFVEKIANRLAGVVKQSLGRLQPFDTVGHGQAKVEKVASDRRMPRGDGRVHSPRFSYTKNGSIRNLPEGEIDPYLKTVTLAKGDKPLVRLHYYATHPQSWYRDGRASYDFVGMARQRLEKKEGVFQIYFTGCSGDITVGKYNDATPETREKFAQRIQKGMEGAIAATKWAPVEKIGWKTVPMTLPLRTDKGYTDDDSRAVMNNPKGKDVLRTRAARRLIYSQRHDRPIDVSVLRLADVSILHLPGEPFLTYQLHAQKARPDRFVAVAGYGDGGPCYMCDAKAYGEGGYEPTATTIKPESEKVIRDVITEALKDD
jgi:hypothetical protein